MTRDRETARRRFAAGIVVALFALSLVACGGSSKASSEKTPTESTSAQSAATQAPAAPPALTIEAVDYSYNLPETVPGGWVDVTFSNTGKENHNAQLVRLNDGVTTDQFQAALEKSFTPEGNPADAMALVRLVGGPATTAPGGKSEVMLNLNPGQYALFCFETSEDGTPHLAKGQLKYFTVTAPANTAQPPAADATVGMHEFAFDMPDTLTAGKRWFKLEDSGAQPHEMSIVKLNEGTTLDDLKPYLGEGDAEPSGPPPFEMVGGLQGLGPHGSALVSLDLTPGNYVAVCFIPDSDTGKPHAELGMIKEFAVK